MAKIKIGDKVEAVIIRSGGEKLLVVGQVVAHLTAFGRQDLIIGKAQVLDQFTVNSKNVKRVKTAKNKG